MSTRNTGVKGVLNDYKLHMEQLSQVKEKEAAEIWKQAKGIAVQQDDYLFSDGKPSSTTHYAPNYIDDEAYLSYMESPSNACVVVMTPENDTELIHSIMHSLSRKYQIDTSIYVTSMVQDTSVVPMVMRHSQMLPQFLTKYQHKMHDKEDMESILDLAEQQFLEYGLLE